MSVGGRHAELLGQLAQGVAELTSSERWQDYLRFQSRFHRYSFNNVVLIATQCPEATWVAGFGTWQKMGRFVRRGEKAIWILAPIVARRLAPQDEDEAVLRGFRWVPVFDVSQTDGRDLPSVCRRLVGGDPADHYGRLVDVARTIGFAVFDHEFAGSTNGECHHGARLIRVEARNAPAQRVKTLAHELAHALAHEGATSRALAELEAESVAYVVCQALGIDSSDYSFGYLAGWAGGGEDAVAQITASAERIQRCAARILEVFEPLGACARRPA